jgi:hypothetical protein
MGEEQVPGCPRENNAIHIVGQNNAVAPVSLCVGHCDLRLEISKLSNNQEHC